MDSSSKVIIVVILALLSFLSIICITIGYFNNQCVNLVKDKSAAEIRVVCK